MQLGEFVTLKRGYDLPSSLRVDGSVPVVSSSGVTGRHNTAKVKGPGVVTGRYGTLGEVFFITDDFWPLNTSLYVRDFKGNDPRFSAYFLKSVLKKTHSDKAAVPGVNRNDLHAHRVTVTRDAGEQRAIASILAAYDDFIKNNRRRILALDKAAMLLYREWFIRFRFPGCQRVTITDGVPEHWERKPLGEMADLVMGQSPQSIHYNEVGDGLPFHQGVSDFGTRFPSHRTYCTVLRRVAEPGDILFSVRAPVGRINVAIQRIVIGRGLAAIRSNRNQQSYLLYALRDCFFRDDMIGGGSIFAAVTKKALRRVVLMQAPERIIRAFLKHVRPIERQLEVLHGTTEALCQARNRLLPFLMSGRIVRVDHYPLLEAASIERKL